MTMPLLWLSCFDPLSFFLASKDFFTYMDFQYFDVERNLMKVITKKLVVGIKLDIYVFINVKIAKSTLHINV